ncbi:MAG: hydroxyacid dehydrogenase [Lamprobacter sp.]|uniref:hydroxyacid dehydrogenase n=1 Tax=Lamprobacter sp. TaxID=3100796 RepID=UPI002B258E43|nr:hydroxyacid dehydrogenase [Lamprobacter sp.]MEA3640593.1 hydroxyacid dehydrogenase [Lamprobacter sp.]
MKIYVFDVENWEAGAFDRLDGEHEIQFTSEPLRSANASRYADAEAVSTFIYSSIDRDVLAELPKLKVIASRSTGVDYIDINRCRERGVTVTNVPDYGKTTVAEHVFALLLTLSHRMEEAVQRTRRGDFNARGLQGFDLRGKTIGVVGTGDIGRAVIDIARGFGMEVLAFDVKPDSRAARQQGFTYVALDELLAGSDVITLHVPGNEKTRNMISSEQFDRMHDGAILINTARGSIVDHRALARALVEGKIAAAGLDVLPEEPVVREEAELLRSVYESRHDLNNLLAGQVLIHLRNVVVTPHSAFNTREAVERILETTVDNLAAYADGRPRNIAA